MTCGRSRRSASIAGTTLIAASVEAIPHIDEVDGRLRADLLDGLGQHQRGGAAVRAGDRVVDDVDALVGTHLQRLADRVDGLLGADAQRGHGAVARPSPSAAAPARRRTRRARTAARRRQRGRRCCPTRTAGRRSRRARTSHRRQCSWWCGRDGPSCALGWFVRLLASTPRRNSSGVGYVTAPLSRSRG